MRPAPVPLALLALLCHCGGGGGGGGDAAAMDAVSEVDAAVACGPSRLPWQITTNLQAHTDSGMADDLAFALTPDGEPRIAWLDQKTLQGLWYSWPDGQQWDGLKIDTDLQYFSNLTLVIGSDARAHISYESGADDKTKYAHEGTTWTTEALPSRDAASDAAAVVLDSSLSPHYFYNYLGSYNRNFVHAFNDGQSWETEVVQEAGPCCGGPDDDTVGFEAQAATDSDGFIHISSFATRDRVAYSTNQSGSWQTEFVADVAGKVPGWGRTAIEVTAAGVVHIVFFDGENDRLVHVRGSSGDWTSSVLDDSGDVGYGIELALDPSGGLHAAYTDRDCGTVRYARYTGDAWQLSTVGPGGLNLGRVGLVIDADGGRHVAYVGHLGSGATYAYLAP